MAVINLSKYFCKEYACCDIIKWSQKNMLCLHRLVIVMNIDFDRLRKDFADDRYATSFAGIPEMIMEAWEIESLSDEELLDLARREHINLRKYEK